MRQTNASVLHQLRKLLQPAKEIPAANLLLQSAQLPSANLELPKQSDLLLLRKVGLPAAVLPSAVRPPSVVSPSANQQLVELPSAQPPSAQLPKQSEAVQQRKDGLLESVTPVAVALANLPSALPNAEHHVVVALGQ